MEDRMMDVFLMYLEPMLFQTYLESFLVEIFWHSPAKVFVDGYHASYVGITEVDELLAQRLLNR